MRFLCLHGIGTNSAVLEAQMASIRHRVVDDGHDFQFVEGLFLWPPAKGIEEAYGKQEACYSYFDDTLRSIYEAVLDLAEFLDTDEGGPYDGIIGFSQGGALAATLLAAEARGQISAPRKATGSRLKCAIFLSCGQPWDLEALALNQERRILAETDGECLISIPTAHIWGQNDREGFLGNHEVARICDERVRVEVTHSAGHGIPAGSRPADLDAVVEAFKVTVKMALAESF